MSEEPPSVLWEVAARLVLLSDTHVGPADPAHRRADEPGADLPVDRAPDTGLPRLRATTLAGILRHDLIARTGDTASAGALFGTSAADDPDGSGTPGALDLDDAEGDVPTAITSRAGNRVDPASGTALPGHLWRREILPAGTVFTLHLRLYVTDPQSEAGLLALLTGCVAGLHRSEQPDGPDHGRGSSASDGECRGLQRAPTCPDVSRMHQGAEGPEATGFQEGPDKDADPGVPRGHACPDCAAGSYRRATGPASSGADGGALDLQRGSPCTDDASDPHQWDQRAEGPGSPGSGDPDGGGLGLQRGTAPSDGRRAEGAGAPEAAEPGDLGLRRATAFPEVSGVYQGAEGPEATGSRQGPGQDGDLSLERGTAYPDGATGLRQGAEGPEASGSDGSKGSGPGLHVGARTGRGHGAIAASSWVARRHDLTTAEGWFAHHTRTWAQRRADGESALPGGPPTLADALSRALRTADRPDLADGLPHETPDRRHRDELRLTLAVGEPDDPVLPTRVRPGLLMIADPPPPGRVGTVDRAHRHRPVEGAPEPAPVLGDTALHALLKRLSARLSRDACEALGGHEDLWRHWHAHWWGGDTDPATALPRPSRVRLRRTPVLTGGAPLTTTRLTVDSLFGDAVDGHLSTSDVHCGGTAEAVLDVHEPDDAVRGLLTLLVRDLATVPADTLGSGAGSGHGRLTATAATLTVRTGDGGPDRTVDLLTAVLAPDSTDARLARGWVSRWHARLAPRSVGEAQR